jgi:CheY-like chemotaxis protein
MKVLIVQDELRMAGPIVLDVMLPGIDGFEVCWTTAPTTT